MPRAPGRSPRGSRCTQCFRTGQSPSAPDPLLLSECDVRLAYDNLEGQTLGLTSGELYGRSVTEPENRDFVRLMLEASQEMRRHHAK